MAVLNPVTLGTNAPASLGTTIVLTTAAATLVASRILLFVSWYDALNSITISSISDGVNTYTVDKTLASLTPGGGHAAIISAHAPSILALGSAITVTMSSAVLDRAICGAYSTGILTTGAAYGAVGQAEHSNTAWSSTTTPVTTGDLMWGGSHWEDSGGSTNTPSGGNTELHDGIGSSGTFTTTCYQIGSGTSIAASGTWSSVSGASEGTTSIAVAYKAIVPTGSFIPDQRRNQRNSLLRRSIYINRQWKRNRSGILEPQYA